MNEITVRIYNERWRFSDSSAIYDGVDDEQTLAFIIPAASDEIELGQDYTVSGTCGKIIRNGEVISRGNICGKCSHSTRCDELLPCEISRNRQRDGVENLRAFRRKHTGKNRFTPGFSRHFAVN